MTTPRPTLVLVNGAPGSGKSTVAAALAARRPLALALDIDTLKHSLGGWDQDLRASGLQARALALALARRHLSDGHDVVIGQYLARTPFLEQLEELAADCGARFVETALVLAPQVLAARLEGRRRHPDRPEQRRNDRFVGPGDAADLAASIDHVLTLRPGAVRIDAARELEDVVDEIAALLGPPILGAAPTKEDPR